MHPVEKRVQAWRVYLVMGFGISAQGPGNLQHTAGIPARGSAFASLPERGHRLLIRSRRLEQVWSLVQEPIDGRPFEQSPRQAAALLLAVP
jgi:hypothetical protein